MNLQEMNSALDDLELKDLSNKLTYYNAATEPAPGDFVDFNDGSSDRIVKYDQRSLQRPFGGKFYLSYGVPTYIGIYHPTLVVTPLLPTKLVREGVFWMFHYDRKPNGEAAMTILAPCRVWSAPTYS